MEHAGIKQFSIRDDNEFKKLFELLKSGDKEINLSEQYRDVVLLLGNTGAGKSTFSQWISGNDDQLIATEVNEGSGEFIIEDNNRIGNSTIESTTIFPELIIYNKTNTAFYDCPGFDDTRSTANDIATTYFIKKVIDHSDRLKIIFIINYPSVRKGVDRQDFMKLTKHATDLLKDIDKFRNGIAIVVTKVDNTIIRQKGNYVLVGDNIIIRGIVNFLQEVKDNLEKDIKYSGISSADRQFYFKAMKFIDILLSKNGRNYSNIGIFRRPDQPGPLGDIELLQEGKVYINEILYENLKFTVKNENDFGYTISEKSKNDINDLVENIDQNVSDDVHNITIKLSEFYEELVEYVRLKIRSFVTSETVVSAELSESEEFIFKLSNGYNVTKNLLEELENITNPAELAEKMNTSMLSLDLTTVDNISDYINELNRQGKYFNFLQLVSDKQLRGGPWGEYFKEVLLHLSNSQTNVQNDVLDVAKMISNYIKDTINAIRDHYNKKMMYLDIQELPAELKSEREIFFNIGELIKNVQTDYDVMKIINNIKVAASNVGINIPKSTIPIIANYNKYFNYLQVISKEKLDIGTSSPISPIDYAIKFLDKSEKWYIFINDLYHKFSGYEIQEDTSKYNVKDLKYWGMNGKPQGLELNTNNIQLFLNLITKYNVAEFDNIRNITFTDLQLAEFNNVITLTLKSKITVSCRESSLFITGNYIKIQDVVSILERIEDKSAPLNDYIVFDNSFDNININYINVYAFNTIFITKDHKFSKLIPLIVIAPIWNILGYRQIDMNGVTPNEPSPKKAAYGIDGLPGKAGGPGGTFFGIGETFLNGGKLAILAKGGAGGSGQDGGNGKNGNKGVDAVIPSEECRPYDCDDNRKIDGFDCVKLSYQVITNSPDPTRDIEFLYLIIHCELIVFGKPGYVGGDGGSGGLKGIGGISGSITLFELGGNSGIIKYANNGSEGKNGRGGNRGEGGTCGDGKRLSYYFNNKSSDWKLMETIRNDTKAVSGVKGKDGGNGTGRELPKNPKIIEEPAKFINECKSYFRENLNDRFQKKNVFHFLTLLTNNDKVKHVYNTLGLVDELRGIEEQYHRLSTDVDFLPFYQSILNRVSEYAQHPQASENGNQYKKVLNYLYTAILSRIYKVKGHPEPNLVINVNEYVKSVKGDVDKLKDVQKIKNKSDLIKNYKEEYNNGINTKITEAKDLITKFITPELENIGNDIDTKINSLINEVIEKENEAKEEEEMLKNLKKKLQRQLLLQSIFSPLNILGQVLGLLGPLGEVGSSLIGLGTSVAESFLLDETRSGQSTLEVPGGVSYVNSLIKDSEIFQNLVESFKQLLEDISQDLDMRSEKIGDLSSKIDDIKKKLNRDDRKLSFKEIRDLQNEFERELKSIQQKLIETQKHENLDNEEKIFQIVLRADPNPLQGLEELPKRNVITTKGILVKSEKDGKTDKNDKQKLEQAVAILDKYIKMGNVLFNLGIDTYNKVKSIDSAIDLINSEIKKAQENYRELKKFEEYIYSSIEPTLQKIKNDMEDIRSKLGTKSEIALDITKWQVQSALKDIQLQMKHLTAGFQVQDNLVRCIEKLQDAMTMLTNIYDHIQDYQEHQKFASYIADISSAMANNIGISDSKLNNAINYLDITINSNIVLQRYQTAIDALKQFVFPFADIYFRELILPPYLELRSNRSNIDLGNQVQVVGKQIEIIERELETYKLSITGQEELISEGEFSSNYISTKPFYVWENKDHYKEISKFLSGDEVILKADVMNSPKGKDAIKFNIIEFVLKSKNVTLQPEIDDKLKGYRVKATHLGNSYYRYKDKIYLITTGTQPIWYSYEKKHNSNEPVDVGGAYDKIKNGDFMLSPYTLWKIVLTNLTDQATFKEIEIYKDEMYIELSGIGNYIVRDVNEPDLMVEKYYKEIGTYVQPNQSEKIVSTLKKRDIPFELKNAETLFSQDNTKSVNKNYFDLGKLFSWINFPNLNIIPGAEANIIEGKCLENQYDLQGSLFDRFTVSVNNSMKLLKNVLSNKISNLAEYSEEIYYYYLNKDNPISFDTMMIGFENHPNNNDIQTTISTDLHGNIILGQLIANKVFGGNKCHGKPYYISPEQKQINRIYNLESKILPIAKNNYTVNDFINSYNSSPQWYQDLNRIIIEEIISKQNYRKMKKFKNNVTDEILSHLGGIFNDTTPQ